MKRWLTVASLLVAIGLAIGLFRTFGYKLTIGNIIGLRVTRIGLVDTMTLTAFDENGSPIRMDDSFVSDFKNPARKTSSPGRTLLMTIPGAKNAYVYFDNFHFEPMSGLGSQFEARFPVQDGSKSVPFRVEATADDWQVVGSWDPRASKDVQWEPSGDCVLVSVGIPAQFANPNGHTTDYKIDFEPKNPLADTWNTTHGVKDRVTSLFRGSKEEITKVTVLRRQYSVIRTGFLAFGRKGSVGDRMPEDHRLVLHSLYQTQRQDTEIGEQWSPTGQSQEYHREQSSMSVAGDSQPDMRPVNFRFLLGEFSENPGIEVRIGGKSVNFSQCWTGRYIQDKSEQIVMCLIDPSLKQADVNVRMAMGSYQPIFRTGKPRTTKREFASEQDAIIESNPQKRYDRPIANLMVKVPEKFQNQDLLIKYIDSNGNEHDSGVRLNIQKGFVGTQVQMTPGDLDKVQGLAVYARPFTTRLFKDVHLYPRSGFVRVY